MNTHELMNLLRERYPKDAYAFFTEVPDGTGSNCRRHCDALVMSLWPSRGLTLTGFELKVSRADWLKELKQPAKAESIARYCDYWFIVTGDDKIIQTGELPPTWGLMTPKAGKLKVKTEAPKLEAEPLSRKFIAGLFRAAQSQITKEAELAVIKQAEFQRGHKAGRESLQNEVDRLRQMIREFEQKSGVELQHYNIGSLVEAMLIVKNGELTNAKWQIEQIRQKAERVIEALKDPTKAQPVIQAQTAAKAA